MPDPSFDANAYKAEQGREWGRSAAGWKQHWDIWEKGAQHINARLVELAHLQPGHKVVDIATGLGEAAFTAARQVGPNSSAGASLSSVISRVAGRYNRALFSATTRSKRCT